MTAVALDLFSAAMSLTESDRLDLASRLIASVDGEPDADWDARWLDELDRREQRATAGDDPGSSWEEAKARILSRLREA